MEIPLQTYMDTNKAYTRGNRIYRSKKRARLNHTKDKLARSYRKSYLRKNFLQIVSTTKLPYTSPHEPFFLTACLSLLA